MAENYYEILGIPSDADEREIKRAYHRLARDLHPDKASSPDEAKAFEERFAKVSAAYNALKDPQKREEMRKKSQAQPPPAAPGKSTATASVLSSVRSQRPATGAGGSKGPGKGGSGLTPERIAIAQKAFTRGMQFFKENNYVKAISFFEAAIQNNENEAIYHARLASALIQAHRSATRAIEEAQKAIDLDPYNLDLKFNLGFIFETIGSTSNAQKVYEDIMRWDADNERARIGLQELKKKKKRSNFGLGSPANPDAKPSFLQNLLDKFKK